MKASTESVTNRKPEKKNARLRRSENDASVKASCLGREEEGCTEKVMRGLP
jgi:hypothetical protein